ncbi:MAG: hypothetical protein ABGW95_02355, partial [Candidatus Poseidoniia archaeon]
MLRSHSGKRRVKVPALLPSFATDGLTAFPQTSNIVGMGRHLLPALAALTLLLSLSACSDSEPAPASASTEQASRDSTPAPVQPESHQRMLQRLAEIAITLDSESSYLGVAGVLQERVDLAKLPGGRPITSALIKRFISAAEGELRIGEFERALAILERGYELAGQVPA